VRKVNAHSKYVWAQARHSDEFEIRMHEIVKDKGEYNVLKIRMKPLS
jgi:hypothetical protein